MCVDGQCMSACDPEHDTTEVGSCEGEYTCIELLLEGQQAGYGACFDLCAAWEEPLEAGCEVDEWCMPSTVDSSVGKCVDGSGTAEISATCEVDSNECAPGLTCITFDGESVCTLLCDVDAETDTPGYTCPDSQACLPLFDGENNPLSLGTCKDSCDYDEEVSCTNPDNMCIPGELTTGPDLCLSGITELSWLASCSEAGLYDFDICGPTRVCIDIPGFNGLTCHALCRSSKGPLNSAHPDCPNGVFCQEAFPDPTFGICVPM